SRDDEGDHRQRGEGAEVVAVVDGVAAELEEAVGEDRLREAVGERGEDQQPAPRRGGEADGVRGFIEHGRRRERDANQRSPASSTPDQTMIFALRKSVSSDASVTA